MGSKWKGKVKNLSKAGRCGGEKGEGWSGEADGGTSPTQTAAFYVVFDRVSSPTISM